MQEMAVRHNCTKNCRTDSENIEMIRVSIEQPGQCRVLNSVISRTVVLWNAEAKKSIVSWSLVVSR